MATYRFDEIAINSTKKKKPTEEDKVHYIGLEPRLFHLKQPL